MKKVKFLNTSAGSYGIAHIGDELVLQDSHAAQLEKLGNVKILGDAKDAKESVAQSGSFRIADQTSKEKVTEEKEDKFDPTNEKKNSVKATEKNSKAGPNAPKKK